MAAGLKVCISVLYFWFVAHLVCHMEMSTAGNRVGSYYCSVKKYKYFESEDYTAVRKIILL
jgi:hypothetical protein